MNYKKNTMKAPPRKPRIPELDPTHPMNTERTRGLPKMKRGASKHHNFGQIITGNYSSDK